MKALLLILVSVGLSQAALAGKRHHKAHVHGEGKLAVAVDGSDLEIQMEIPAMNIVGFEHMPKTDAQKKQVKKAISSLRDSGLMFDFPAEAKCKLINGDAESSLEGKKKSHGHDHGHGHGHGDDHGHVHGGDHGHGHGEDHSHGHKHEGQKEHTHKHASDHHDGHEGEDGHSEFEVKFTFKCSAPKQLKHITFKVFRMFSSLKELDGQAVTAGGQFAKKLTPKENRFSLTK